MNKASFRMAGMLALALMAATQVKAQQPLYANVPFGFTAGKIDLPAGTYRIMKVADHSPAVLIQRTDGGPAVFLISSAALPKSQSQQSQSKLVFHRYGDRYFLSQVWREDAVRGRWFPVTAEEKEQAIALNNLKQSEVAIVAGFQSPKP